MRPSRMALRLGLRGVAREEAPHVGGLLVSELLHLELVGVLAHVNLPRPDIAARVERHGSGAAGGEVEVLEQHAPVEGQALLIREEAGPLEAAELRDGEVCQPLGDLRPHLVLVRSLSLSPWRSWGRGRRRRAALLELALHALRVFDDPPDAVARSGFDFRAFGRSAGRVAGRILEREREVVKRVGLAGPVRRRPSPVKSGSAAGGAGGAGGTSALCATSCLEKPTPLRPATT